MTIYACYINHNLLNIHELLDFFVKKDVHESVYKPHQAKESLQTHNVMLIGYIFRAGFCTRNAIFYFDCSYPTMQYVTAIY